MRAQKSLSATTLPYHVFGLTHPGRSCGDPHQAPLNDTVTARGRAQCTVDDRIRYIVLLDEGDVSVDPAQVSHFPDEVVWVPVWRVCHFVELAVVRFAAVPVRLPVIGHESQCMRMHEMLTSSGRWDRIMFAASPGRGTRCSAGETAWGRRRDGRRHRCAPRLAPRAAERPRGTSCPSQRRWC